MSPERRDDDVTLGEVIRLLREMRDEQRSFRAEVTATYVRTDVYESDQKTHDSDRKADAVVTKQIRTDLNAMASQIKTNKSLVLGSFVLPTAAGIVIALAASGFHL